MAKISQKWLNRIDGVSLDIASAFANKYSVKMYGSEISKELSLPQRTVSRKLKILTEIGVLSYIREGRNKLYYLNHLISFNKQFLIFLESYKAMKFFVKYPKISIMLQDALKESGCVVFGSYAEGNANKDSDLDIVFLSKKESKIKNQLKKSSIDLHMQFLSYQEFKKKLKNKNTLAVEIARKHVILSNFDTITNIFLEHYYG